MGDSAVLQSVFFKTDTTDLSEVPDHPKRILGQGTHLPPGTESLVTTAIKPDLAAQFHMLLCEMSFCLVPIYELWWNTVIKLIEESEGGWVECVWPSYCPIFYFILWPLLKWSSFYLLSLLLPPCSTFRGYLVAAPSVFRAGVEESVSITIFNAKAETRVQVQLSVKGQAVAHSHGSVIGENSFLSNTSFLRHSYFDSSAKHILK